jgi:hypothetical protein
MAEKQDGITEPRVQPEPVEPAPEPKPETEPETFEIPDELKGKSQEDLAKMVLETKKKLGEQGDNLGNKVKDLEAAIERNRQDAEDRQRAYDMYNQPQVNYGVDPYGRTLQPEPQTSRQFQYEDADSEVRRIIQEEDAKKQQQFQVGAVQQAQNEGKYAFQQGRQEAYRSNPDLFKGIEREVEQRVFQTYAPYAQKGVSVKEFVGNPDIWNKVAYNVHLDNQDFDRITPRKQPPVQATQTETPTPARTALTETRMTTEMDWNDPETQALLRGYGKTPEEAREIIEKEQERWLKGEATDIQRRKR